jgi:hypothetical protein
LISRAKLSTFKRICHPDRSEAQWRDLLFLFRFAHRIVILSAAPRRLIVRHRACGAESKDLGDAYFTHAARSFSATEAEDVDVSAEHRKTLTSSWFSAPGKSRAGSVVEKL